VASKEKRQEGRNRYVWAVASFLLLLFLLSFFSHRGLISLYRLYRTEQHLRLQIQESKAKNAALKQEVTSWQEDYGKIEKAAREELRLVKPGELVYQF
jgi:cell division protein FtsB